MRGFVSTTLFVLVECAWIYFSCQVFSKTDLTNSLKCVSATFVMAFLIAFDGYIGSKSERNTSAYTRSWRNTWHDMWPTENLLEEILKFAALLIAIPIITVAFWGLFMSSKTIALYLESHVSFLSDNVTGYSFAITFAAFLVPALLGISMHKFFPNISKKMRRK